MSEHASTPGPILSGIFQRWRDLDHSGKARSSDDWFILVHRRLFTSGAIRKLHGARLHVLLALVMHANAEAEAWPTQQRLAEHTGYSVAAVNRAVQGLETDGFIQRERLRGDDGTFSGATRYKLHLPGAEEAWTPHAQNAKVEPDSPFATVAECEPKEETSTSKQETPNAATSSDDTEELRARAEGMPSWNTLVDAQLPLSDRLLETLARVEASGVGGKLTERFLEFVAGIVPKLETEADRQIVQAALTVTADKQAKEFKSNPLDYFVGVLLNKAKTAARVELIGYISQQARARGWENTTKKALTAQAELLPSYEGASHAYAGTVASREAG